jgi:hypothetical protein
MNVMVGMKKVVRNILSEEGALPPVSSTYLPEAGSGTMFA